MTPRPLARTRRAAVGIAIAGLLFLAGCDPRSLAYFLQPFDPTIPPTGPKLKGKRVVILTHAVSSALADAPDVDRELAQGLARILHEKVKKVDVVDLAKVRTWAEANPSWTDASEAAKAFEADAVIFLDVSEFQIQSPSSPGLFEGKSTIQIQVTEMAPPKDPKGRPISDMPKVPGTPWDDTCTTTFPSRGPIPMDSNVGRPAFKKKFLDLVASEISWRFVDHAPGDNIQDTNFNK